MVTEVTLKIRPVPPLRKYASFVFPDFDTGVRFMRQVAAEVVSFTLRLEQLKQSSFLFINRDVSRLRFVSWTTSSSSSASRFVR